jgi:hypothetical protein
MDAQMDSLTETKMDALDTESDRLMKRKEDG